MDDTSAMWDNWPIGSWHTKLLFDCFTRLILTLKQAPRMHQNAPLPDKKSIKISGEGAQPPPQTPPPQGRGYPLPRRSDPTPLGTFGARRSRSFSFTTRTLAKTHWKSDQTVTADLWIWSLHKVRWQPKLKYIYLKCWIKTNTKRKYSRKLSFENRIKAGATQCRNNYLDL